MMRAACLAAAIMLASCGADGSGVSVSDENTQNDAAPLSPLVTQYDDLAAVVNSNGAAPFPGDALGFGTARGTVDAAMEAAFGAPPQRSTGEGCGAGPTGFSQFGPLQLAYRDGNFAGWYLSESPVGGEGENDGVTTIDGIRPGVSLFPALSRDRPVRELDSTLPGEFEYTASDYGTIGGFHDDGRITSLHAGLTCFFL